MDLLLSAGTGHDDGRWVVMAHDLLSHMSVVLANLRSVVDGDHAAVTDEVDLLTTALHEADVVTSLLGRAVRGLPGEATDGPADGDPVREVRAEGRLPGAYVRLLAGGDFRCECPRCGWVSLATTNLDHAGRTAAAHRRGGCEPVADLRAGRHRSVDHAFAGTATPRPGCTDEE